MRRIHIKDLTAVEVLSRAEMQHTRGGFLGGLFGFGFPFLGGFGRFLWWRRRPRVSCFPTLFGPRCFVSRW